MQKSKYMGSHGISVAVGEGGRTVGEDDWTISACGIEVLVGSVSAAAGRAAGAQEARRRMNKKKKTYRFIMKSAAG